MIKPGYIQKLKIVKKTDFGVYLSDGTEEKVLLPIKQEPAASDIGD
ncbi:MAG: RNA-binding protein, partial [Lachnospiraceae bacterium]|nr:RNA-binding protein [Lachnospiraceae bacterium]